MARRRQDTTDRVRRRIMDAFRQATPPITLKQASRAIGRNDAYLQQFLQRGTPRHLPELVRHRLAAYLGLDQRQLIDGNAGMAIIGNSPLAQPHLDIPFLDLAASAGAGAHVGVNDDGHDPANQLRFPRHWLQRLGGHSSSALRLISISGDSMAPRLEHDDLVMLDTSQKSPSPPGIFILHDGVGLVAKQIELIPNTQPQMLQIRSENPAYRTYRRCIDEVRIIGRVVWFGRRI